MFYTQIKQGVLTNQRVSFPYYKLNSIKTWRTLLTLIIKIEILFYLSLLVKRNKN